MQEIPVVDIKMTEIKKYYKEGYKMLGKLREEAQSPVVKAKIFNKEAVIIYGEEAAKHFYDPRNFKREGAMPKMVQKTLFGKDGVQSLDGAEHHHRKAIFMDLMTPERMDDYHQILDRVLAHELEQQHGTFELFDLSKKVLFTAICEWSGINLADYSEEEINQLADYQISMISGTVTSPLDHFKGVENRKKSEKWAQELLEEARENPVAGKENVAFMLLRMRLTLKVIFCLWILRR